MDNSAVIGKSAGYSPLEIQSGMILRISSATARRTKWSVIFLSHKVTDICAAIFALAANGSALFCREDLHMNWFDKNDNTPPVISAKSHISSSHGNKETPKVPPTCLIFEMGMAMAHLETAFAARTLMERLPCFLENQKCLDIADMEGVCFTRGGYGAPAAVDTLKPCLRWAQNKSLSPECAGCFPSMRQLAML